MSCADCPEPAPPPARHAVTWRAWYVGGRVFDSRDLSWSDLPDVGVLGVVVFFADGTRRMCSGDTWYWRLQTATGWTIAHSSDPMDELVRVYGEQPWKRGQWTDEEEMHAVNAAMTEAR